MAKRIKAIKCPSCGSVKITELRPDYYKCNSCGTDFFLDSDDININHNYNIPRNTNTVVPKIAIGVAIAVVFLFVLKLLFSTRSSHHPQELPYTAPAPAVTQQEAPTYNWDNSAALSITDNQQHPYIAKVGQLYANLSERFNDSKPDKIYLALFDAVTSDKKWIRVLTELPPSGTKDYQLRVFEDNNLYIMLNHKLVFRLNIANSTIDNVLEQYEKGNDDLSVGIAKIEFNYNSYGSGYKLVTNDGRNLVFMPLINKTYTESGFKAAIKQPVPQPVVTTGYRFSKESFEFPQEKKALIKYTYHYQYGYPKDEPQFGWDKDFGGSGIFTDRSPYKKVFIRDWSIKESRLINYKDITPGRTYFSPLVLASNDSVVMIANKPTPAEDEPYQVQILNGNTGAILKTLSPDPADLRGGGKILKDGYIVNGNKYYYYDINGKKIREVDQYNLKPKDLN
ncbi:hypothetical protein [Chitinophaga sp. 212800010-3]|uniref:hypothetical protein n=1 Tax=unclassified Chitinophaga TaxID=2619133 RepID=UPI002DE74E1F|nr:hypothetical protein [Chitinophaga sp. 212800010-3]